MTTWILIVCSYYGGCMNYEFKDKIQCVSTGREMYKRMGFTMSLNWYCQEVRK